MTWNPIVNCTKVSQGCKNCYAKNMAHRLQAMAQRVTLVGVLWITVSPVVAFVVAALLMLAGTFALTRIPRK
jgi:protein gp37